MASTLQTGEASVFDYFLALTSDTEGTDSEYAEAWRDELPAVFDDANVDKVWTFHYMGGGTSSETRQLPGRSCGLVGQFVFSGIFTSKATAQEYACLLRNNFPADPDELTNVNYMIGTQDPMIQRGVALRDPESTNSGEARVWALTAEWEAGIRST